MLSLYSIHHDKKLDISPSTSDTLTREIMGDAVLSLTFTLWEAIPIEVGDYVIWEGEVYTSLSRQYPQQQSSVEWKYQLQFFGAEHHLKRYLLLSPDGLPAFTLTSPAVEHVKMIVQALNVAEGSNDWVLGHVDATDNLVIDYDGTYLHEAIRRVADAANTEWWIEGKVIHLTRCQWGEEIPLSYGKGLVNIEQSKVDGHAAYTRLYPIGSTRNIDPATYGAASLHLPNGKLYVDLPSTQQLGRIDRCEKEAFAHIYPRRVGTISAVRVEQRNSEGKTFSVYFVKDERLDFDPATHLLAGHVMKFSFQDGAELAGRDFECNWLPASREFELITQWGEENTQLPNYQLPPEVGDHYVLWNMRMPDSYIRAAEVELQQAVAAYNAKNALDLSVYKAKTDFEYLLHHKLTLRLGQRVRLESATYFSQGARSSRISKVVQYLHQPTLLELEMSDNLSKGVMQRISDEVGRVEMQVRRVSASLPQVIHVGDPIMPTDHHLYSALRSHKEFLSKLRDDTALGHITFNNGVTAERLSRLNAGVTFGNYIPSLIGGTGAHIDERGNAEVESIKVRSRMEVAELVVNRQTTMDADFLLTEGDVVERVKKESDGSYILILRKEWEGYTTSLTAGCVLRGIYNNLPQGGSVYETTWAKVESVDTAKNTIRVKLYPGVECPTGVNFAPRPLLRVSRWGHISDANRQSTYLLSSRDQRIALLVNVRKPIIDASNIASWTGKLDGLRWKDAAGRMHDLKGYGNVVGDIYVSGSLHVGGELKGGVVDKLEEVAIARAHLQQLTAESSYLIARADAVLAAHLNLSEEHGEEYAAISPHHNQNARWNYSWAYSWMIAALQAFIDKTATYQYEGRQFNVPPLYAELFNVGVGFGGHLLGDWYVIARNAFEAAIIKADRAKDGRDGRDGQDAHSPRISENGTWLVWDVNAQSYIDTYDPARGESGENGLSPRISDDGYWEVYEGGGWSKTSTKAQGEKGEKGEPGADGAAGKDGARGANGRDGADGADGRGILSITPLYKLHASSTAAPAAPSSYALNGWSEGKPFYMAGSYLWRCEKQRYSDGTIAFTTPMLESEWVALQQMQIGGQNYFGWGKGISSQYYNNPPISDGTNATFSVKMDYLPRPLPKLGGGRKLDGFRLEVAQLHSNNDSPIYGDYRQKCILLRLFNLRLPEENVPYVVSFQVRANRRIAGRRWQGGLLQGEVPVFNVNLCDEGTTYFIPTTEWQRVEMVATPRDYVHRVYYGFLDIELDAGVRQRSWQSEVNEGGWLEIGDWLEFKEVQIERGTKATAYKPSLDYLTQLLHQPTGMEDGVVFGGRIDAQQNGVTNAFLNGVNLDQVPVLAAGHVAWDNGRASADIELWADGRMKLGDKFSWNGSELNLKGRMTLEEIGLQLIPQPSYSGVYNPAPLNGSLLTFGGAVLFPSLPESGGREVRIILSAGMALHPVVKESGVRVRLSQSVNGDRASHRIATALGWREGGMTYWYITSTSIVGDVVLDRNNSTSYVPSLNEQP